MSVDEVALRRPQFDLEQSVPVVMGNHMTFWLPKPLYVVDPLDRDPERVRLRQYAAELEGLVDRVYAAAGARPMVEAVIALGAKLVLANYEAYDAVLEEVLVFRLGDAQSGELLRQVIALATGQSGPKP
jgi:hypothetical protein